MQIRSKILLLVIPLTVLPLLFVGFFSYKTLNESFVKQSSVEDQRICFTAASSVEQILDDCRDGLLILSSPIGNQINSIIDKGKNHSQSAYKNVLEQLIVRKNNSYREIAQEFAMRFSPFVQIRIISASGVELFKTNSSLNEQLHNISDESIFLPSISLSYINHNLFQLPPVKVNDINSTTFCTGLFYDSGINEKLTGFIYLDLDMKIFYKILNSISKTNSGYYVLFDGKRNILSEGGSISNSEKRYYNRELWQELRPVLDNSQSEFLNDNIIFSGKQYFISTRPVKEYIVSRDPIPEERWFIAYIHTETPIISAFRQSKLLFFIVLGIGCIIAVTGTIIISKKITVPIGQLNLAAQEFAKGNLDSSIKISSHDEIGRLSENFNFMAREINGLIQERKTNEALIAIGKFSASLAHDLRNPVEGLKLLSKELCRRIVNNSEQHEIADTIVQSVDRLSSFINQSLDFTRLTKPVLKETDIIELTEAVLNDFQFGNIELTKNYENVLPLIYVDTLQIKRVIANIIRNAIEECNKNSVMRKGKVSLNVKKINDRIVIEIADNGMGISENVISKIFDPFFSTKPEGHGLGLSLARQIIINHGGRIITQSKIELGTCFTIELPIKDFPVVYSIT